MLATDYWQPYESFVPPDKHIQSKRKHSQFKDTTVYLDISLQGLEERQNVILNVQ